MRTIHIGRNGQNLGAFPEDQIQALVQSGQLVPTDLAWTAGMVNWEPLHQVVPLVSSPPPMPSAPWTGPVGTTPWTAYQPYNPSHNQPAAYTKRIGWIAAMVSTVLMMVMLFVLTHRLLIIMEEVARKNPQLFPQGTPWTSPNASGSASPDSSPAVRARYGTAAQNQNPFFNPDGTPAFSQENAAMMGLSYLGFLLAWAINTIFLSILYHRCWRAIPPELRSMTPGKAVGFQLIPIFNVFWMFYCVVKISQNYQQWAAARGKTDAPNAMAWGIAWCAGPLFFMLFLSVPLGAFYFGMAVGCALILLLKFRFFKTLINQAHELNHVA